MIHRITSAQHKTHFSTLNVIILLFIAVICTSCSSNISGYFKRSANNKLFDRAGFEGEKRPPLYNNKYIDKAKKNILQGDYDYDEVDDESLDESENIAQRNIELYQNMIEQDRKELGHNNIKAQKLTKRTKRNQRHKIHSNNLSNTPQHNDNLDPSAHSANLELREEINQIKRMLKDTKNDLASYKCPTARELEKQSDNSHKPAAASKINHVPLHNVSRETKFLAPKQNTTSVKSI